MIQSHSQLFEFIHRTDFIVHWLLILDFYLHQSCVIGASPSVNFDLPSASSPKSFHILRGSVRTFTSQQALNACENLERNLLKATFVLGSTWNCIFLSRKRIFDAIWSRSSVRRHQVMTIPFSLTFMSASPQRRTRQSSSTGPVSQA